MASVTQQPCDVYRCFASLGPTGIQELEAGFSVFLLTNRPEKPVFQRLSHISPKSDFSPTSSTPRWSPVGAARGDSHCHTVCPTRGPLPDWLPRYDTHSSAAGSVRVRVAPSELILSLNLQSLL